MPGQVGERMAALFVVGLLLFNRPFIDLFDVETTVLGIPVLYFYLFAVWAVLIVLMALAIERRARDVGEAPLPVGEPGPKTGEDAGS